MAGKSARVKTMEPPKKSNTTIQVSRSATERAGFPKAPSNRERYEMFRGNDGYIDFGKMEFNRFDTRPQAIRMMKKYISGTDKTRASIVEHLIDENYHEWAKALEEGKAEDVKKWIDDIYYAKAGKAEKEFWKSLGL